MKLLKEDLKLLSNETKIDLSDEYINIIYDNFLPIIEKLEQIKTFKNLDNVKPLDMIFEDQYNTFLRDDDKEVFLSKQDALKNAKQVKKDYFFVKR